MHIRLIISGTRENNVNSKVHVHLLLVFSNSTNKNMLCCFILK